MKKELGNQDTSHHSLYVCLGMARKKMLSIRLVLVGKALINHGILAKRVQDLVMEALEGPPKSDALAEYNQGDRSLKDILGVLDKVYGGQMSYIPLQSELCNIQQADGESVKAFYQRMIPIIVQIPEKHVGHLKEEELANTAKDAFYNGLREAYKPLIAHKVDKPDIRVSRCSRYPPSLWARNNNNNNNYNFDVKYEGHQNCSKTLSMHILRIFGHHHM